MDRNLSIHGFGDLTIIHACPGHAFIIFPARIKIVNIGRKETVNQMRNFARDFLDWKFYVVKYVKRLPAIENFGYRKFSFRISLPYVVFFFVFPPSVHFPSCRDLRTEGELQNCEPV